MGNRRIASVSASDASSTLLTLGLADLTSSWMLVQVRNAAFAGKRFPSRSTAFDSGIDDALKHNKKTEPRQRLEEEHARNFQKTCIRGCDRYLQS